MIPDNGGYATAAYMAAAIIYVVYAFSIRARTRALVKWRGPQESQGDGKR